MNLKANIICLNPKNGLEDDGCHAGILNYEPTLKEQVKYTWGEQYFHILLHEIAHFKFEMKPPKEWINLMGKLLLAATERENARRRKLGDKPLTAKEEKSYALYCLFNNNLGKNEGPYRRTGERDNHYSRRCKDFRHWLKEDEYSRSHILVEKWARKEFKKRRKDIGQLISED